MLHRCLRLLAVTCLALQVSFCRAADVIELHLDATDAPRNRMEAHLKIPAKAGPLTLYYPKWIPGNHSPSGPIADLAGVKIRAGGQKLSWKRDEVDTYALNLTVPAGATQLEVDLEYISPPATEGPESEALSTSRLAVLDWYHALVYPRGSVMQDLEVQPSLILPAGWKMGCALPIATTGANGKIQFKTVTLERLCDSPVLCGEFFKELPVGPPNGAPHYLCIAADSEAALAIAPELKTNYDRLVAEANALFGARHYGSYRFFLTLSDHVSHSGLEHHECSNNRVPERMFLDPVYRKTWHSWLLAHEFVHSWNGKYRRPAGMVVDDFQKPVHTQMLWVYEGLTQYLGLVLAARSGLWTPELSRDNFAHIADWSANQTGRDWRSLEDTAVAAQHLYKARTDGEARRRGVDFYDEGALIWLDADTLIRDKSGGKKSLDDFCKAFFGGKDGPPEVKPYEFEDIVAALNGVVEYDWKGFFNDRVMQGGTQPPLDGLTRGGWKLAYSPTRSDGQQARETDGKKVDLTSSLGLLVKDDGLVVDVIPLKPADKAGIAPGMKLIAVNGRRWTADILRAAVAATKDGQGKLELLCDYADYFQAFSIPYAEGEKYPKLEQVSTSHDLLGDILKPKMPTSEKK